jgi:transposase
MRKLVQPAMQQAVPHQFSISNFKRSPFGRTVFWARMALAMKRIATGLKSLARRYLELHDEIADLDVMIAAIVDELAANLVARNSIGHIGAAQLLLTAGDNPERLRSEASFASLCGVSPVPASSGKTVRHRLNRGGDRAANSALHIIAIGRLRTDQRTKDYVARRIAEGHSKLDAIRALKRYLAREVSRSSHSVAISSQLPLMLFLPL